MSLGDTCAAKFFDGNWYRAKVEKVSGSKVSVFYIDYGNRQDIQSIDCASLPAGFAGDKPFAHSFFLACVSLPNDVSRFTFFISPSLNVLSLIDRVISVGLQARSRDSTLERNWKQKVFDERWIRQHRQYLCDAGWSHDKRRCWEESNCRRIITCWEEKGQETSKTGNSVFPQLLSIIPTTLNK